MKTDNFFDVWPVIFFIDLLRYLIPASLAFVGFYLIGAKYLQHLMIQDTLPKAKQMWRELGYSISTVVIFSLVGYFIFLSQKAGLTQIYHNFNHHSVWYFALSLVAMILIHDFYFYWTHRFMHLKSVFRHIHLVHHQSTNPSPWAAYSFHPLEALIQALVFPLMVFTLPAHPLTLTIFLIYMIVRNVLGHVGFEFLPKGFTKNKWLNWNTAITHHNLHHEQFHSNYGLYFSWWDRLMKTENAQYQEKFEEIKSRPKFCALRTPKKTVTLSVILLLSVSSMAQSVSGKWITYNEETGSPLSMIEIKETNAGIEGKIIKIFLELYQGENPVCTKCSGERKDKKIIDMNLLWGFKQDGDSWSFGHIIDPESGEIYSSKLWLDDNNTLKVRGYSGFFYRTQTWKRNAIANEKTPVGTWQTIDDHWNKVKSIVEIENVNGVLRGYVRKIYLLPHEGTDPVCTECEGDLKNSKVVGMKIIWDFKKVGDKWDDGKILDPGNGSTYSSSLWLIDSDTLKVRGYLGPFYRSQIWKRSRS